ncbi:hypothetical protein JRQ81_014742 [Phrynocephalus forsythii]|uniref:G domain-containing protein n=1 Tax=Phrynocephalus forsythii TaxID=171643 RepID=A0A9Q0Y0I9_9SAUR|nr:hypothetical protein JRQ81_014742 [Phrynocephalus forsythii]
MVGVGETSMTLKYRTYPVITGSNGQQLPILFCDTMGLEEREGACLKVDDVMNIIKGHVPNGYQFNPVAAMKPSTPGYIKSPSFKDQIHCIVFVVDGSRLDILPEKMEEKLKEIKHKAKEFDVPQIVVMTKVDEICSSLKDNISDVYKSTAVLEQMQRASLKFGIPLSLIAPVKNYCSELELNNDVDILILMALRQIFRSTESYLDNFCLDPSHMVWSSQHQWSQSEHESSSGADSMLEKPWRLIDWTSEERQELMKEIAQYESPLNSVQKIRVLFLGQISAGKSSFFNSLDSVFQGHVLHHAPEGTDDRSVTKKYKTYQVKNGSNGNPLPIIFCDTMGLEENYGLNIGDVSNLLQGHVPEGYQFNLIAAMEPSAHGYIESPSLNERTHCVVFIIDGFKIEILPEKVLEKLKEIRRQAIELELPQLVIFTKVDEICSVLEEDVSDVYKSQAVKRKMEVASNKLGIPLGNIVPVKNYCSEVDLKDHVDILLLKAVRQIVRYAHRYLESFPSD